MVVTFNTENLPYPQNQFSSDASIMLHLYPLKLIWSLEEAQESGTVLFQTGICSLAGEVCNKVVIQRNVTILNSTTKEDHRCIASSEDSAKELLGHEQKICICISL